MLVLFHALYFVSQYVAFAFSKALFKNNREHGAENQTLLITPHKESNKSVLREKYHVSGEADFSSEYGLRFTPPVYVQRYFAVQAALEDERWKGRIRKVVDFGCAEFGFFTFLKKVAGIHEVLEVDIDDGILEAHYCRTAPLNSDYLHPRGEPLSVYILKGSIADTDVCLKGCDAVVCIELIEHVYPDVLEDIPYTVFGFIKPLVAIFTTPNGEFNVLFPDQKAFRHPDHKFEWAREQFECWANNIVLRYPDYKVHFQDIGPGPAGTDRLGGCSQMAVFELTPLPPPAELAPLPPSAPSVTFHSACLQPADAPRKLQTTHYRLLREYSYPFCVDTRTPQMKMRDQAEYYIRMLASCERFSNNDVDGGHQIPLSTLLPTVSAWSDSLELLESVLREGGWPLVPLPEGGWAVAVPPDSSENSASDLDLDSDSVSHRPQAWHKADAASSSESDWDSDENGQGAFEAGPGREVSNPWGSEEWLDEAVGSSTSCLQTRSQSAPSLRLRACTTVGLRPVSSPVPPASLGTALAAAQAAGDSNIKMHADKSVLTLLPLRHPICFSSSGSGVTVPGRSRSPSPGEEAADVLADSGYPNSASAQEADLTPEQVEELFTEHEAPTSSSDSGSDPGSPRPPPAGSPPPPAALLEAAMNVENGDVANNNRDWEGNNAAGAGEGGAPVGVGVGLAPEELLPLLAAAADRDNDNAPGLGPEAFPLWLLHLLGLAQGGAAVPVPVAPAVPADDSDAEDEGLGAASDSAVSDAELEQDSDLSGDAAEDLASAIAPRPSAMA